MSEVENSPSTAAQRRPSSRWRFFVIAMWLFTLVILFSRVSVYVELASHFVWQAILSGTLIMVGCALWRRWRLLVWAAVPWCYWVLLFQPWWLWFGQPEPALPHSLKVMTWNVLCLNEELDEIRAVIESHPVDILLLIEVRPNLFEQVPELDQLYKHRLAFPSWGGNGIAMLTRRDDVVLSRIDFDGSIMPSIVARTSDGAMQLVGMHTWSPVPPSRAVPRDRQLRSLCEWTLMQNAPVCVVGDLNITPWAPMFGAMKENGFIDSRTLGFGNSASWPASLGAMGIPIDHVLTHGACRVTQRQLGPMVSGSDHRPVLFEVTY